MYCPGGNAPGPIWRVLASSDGISFWTSLKPQHSNPNPNPLANQLWCIDFLTPPTPLINPHRLPAFLESLMPLKNWCSIHARCSKSSLKHSIRFCGIFSKFSTEFYCISTSSGASASHYRHLLLLTCPQSQKCASSLNQTLSRRSGSSSILFSNERHITKRFSMSAGVSLSYLPTSPLGQDMTEGQFLSRV